ncbi:glycosyltransferase [Salinivibrio costicola]|uniref:Glycosyltransferase n=1 Tax=Salinivibrio costicola TaxID=51367 RepID=A0ABX6K694_SALCS|nr:glycosyltransferase [Salinivibrio costicola]QIR06504.1 glycosyltransferase [Salinivibrio costicola]
MNSVLLFIDHFGSGGAQRQIVLIANGLSQRGIDVHLVNYYPHLNHYRSNIYNSVKIHDFSKKGKVGLSVIIKLRKLLKTQSFKSALVFLDTPALYLEIANLLLWNKISIVYSERSSLKLRPNGFFSFLKRNLHRFCGHITSNSISQTNILKKMYKNVSYIPNIIPNEILDEANNIKFKFDSKNITVVSHTRPFKNFTCVANALIIYWKKYNEFPPKIDWYGEIYPSVELDDSIILLKENGLEQHLVFHGATRKVYDVLKNTYFLIHPSKFESSANSVTEALSTGTPVLLGDIDEHSMLLECADVGYSFDVEDANSLAILLHKVSHMSIEHYEGLASQAREYANNNYREKAILDSYISLLMEDC